MTTLVLGLAALALGIAIGLFIYVERERRLVSRRLDRLANRLSGSPRPFSKSPGEALDRFEITLEASEAGVGDPASEKRYLAALAALPLGVVIVDDNGVVIFNNEPAAWFREGRHGEAVVAQTIDELIDAAIVGNTVEETVQLYGPPRRRLVVSASPIVEEGGASGAIVLIDDVTERERIDSIRREFVTNISHELRTPIGAMSLLAETLVGEHDPEVIDSLAGRLSKEAERLSDTVQDLLELSRIEHGGDSAFEPLILQTVVAGAHDRVRAAAQQRDVAIGISLPDRDLSVKGDRRQLTSAVFNLLDNAVKYSSPGGGTVSVRGREVDGEIELVVQDSGIGIPRKDLDRIFERFYRVDRGRSRASGGTGLGLSMVRHIVANHGGRITVDSTEGEGSTFTIALPALSADDRPDGGPNDHEVSTK